MGMIALSILFAMFWIGGLVYCLLGVVAARRFRSESGSAGQGVSSPTLTSATPASLLKPLSGDERGLEESLESFFRQDYPDYEILFAVGRDDDPALDVVERLRLRHPERSVRVLVAESPYPNAKVYSMELMARHARGDVLVISDSDVRVTPDYLRAVTRPFADRGVGVVTCPYRGAPGSGLWSRLEALAMTTRFMPGVLVAWLLETKRLLPGRKSTGLEFALGPTMAVRRECLDAIGGFSAMAQYLADDFVLGKWAAERGYRVELSPYVLDHLVLGESFTATARHQLRWARSTRCSRPVGYVGEGFTHPTAWALLAAAALLMSGGTLLSVSQSLLAGFAMVASALAARAWVSWAVGWGALRDTELRRAFWLIPLGDLLGFTIWLGGFTGRTILWRGIEYRLGRDGRFEPIRAGTALDATIDAASPIVRAVAELEPEPIPQPSKPGA
jgi:ceramide glucosyltransferase